MDEKESIQTIHILRKDKVYLYRNIEEFLVSNSLSTLVLTTLIADLKMFLKQEEKIGGLYSHQSDNAHSDIYNIMLDIIKNVAQMNISVFDNKTLDLLKVNQIGDNSISFDKYNKLLELHKHVVGGTYLDSETLFDFEFVYNIDSACKLLHDIKEYETTNSRNAVYIKSKPVFDEAAIKNTIYPLYNYLFNTEQFFKM